MQKKRSQQPVSQAPRPIEPLKASYTLPTQPPAVPKPRDPKKTPGKKVRRELDPGYQSIGAFLSIVEGYTTQEFIATTPGYKDVPYFQEFVAVDGIEVLSDVFNRLNTEFQDRNEIHWFLSSCWKEGFPERHIFLIACGIWKFILLHSEEAQEDNSGATHHQEVETGEAIEARKPVLFEVLDPEYYMKLVVNGEILKIGASQGKAIKLLHESCQKGSPFVPYGEVKKAMGLEYSSRLRDSFKGKTSERLWDTLIIREGRTLRLNIPPPSTTHQ